MSWSTVLAAGSEKVTTFLIASYLKTEGEAYDGLHWGRLIRDVDELATGVVGGIDVARGTARRAWKCVWLVTKCD